VSDEDELRRRLQDVPGPRAGLDVDAAVQEAKRRRRPKVAALTAAATGAGVLIIAPFAVAGMQGLSPVTTASMSESGQQAPPAEQDGGDGSTDGGEASTGATDTGTGAPEAGPAAAAAPACHYPGITDETGISAAFADDPADGSAAIEFTFAGSGGEVRVLGVAVAQVLAGSGTLAIASAPDVSAFPEASGFSRASGSGGGVVVVGQFELVDASAIECGVDGPTAPAPLLLIELDGQRLAVVGDPWGVR
jgi:hypothetical protein